MDGLRDLTILMISMNKHIIGDADDADSTMIKPSLKELIVNRCLGIEKRNHEFQIRHIWGTKPKHKRGGIFWIPL